MRQCITLCTADRGVTACVSSSLPPPAASRLFPPSPRSSPCCRHRRGRRRATLRSRSTTTTPHWFRIAAICSLPAGRSKQDFPDVSAQIRPETVTLTGNGLGIVEQNFDFDLLTPAGDDAEGGRRDRDPGPDQSGDRRRNARTGANPGRQQRRGDADRRSYRGAARRRPADPGDLRPRSRSPCVRVRPCR